MDFAEKSMTKQLDGLTKVKEYVTSQRFGDIMVALYNSMIVGGRIVVTGIGKNAAIAKKSCETGASLGINTMYLDTANALHGDLGFVQREDIIFFLSKSGTTKETCELFRQVRVLDIDTTGILVHCGDFAMNGADIDINLGNINEADLNGLAPTTSSTMFIAFLDTVFATLSYLMNFKKEDFLRLHPSGALGDKLREELECE